MNKQEIIELLKSSLSIEFDIEYPWEGRHNSECLIVKFNLNVDGEKILISSDYVGMGVFGD